MAKGNNTKAKIARVAWKLFHEKGYEETTIDEIILQDRHRQRMAITKKELEDLIEANDYDKIFSDYFNTFIVSQCNKVDDVVDGVPNRHGVSHSWYHSYPSKKASLNAILLTDFIIGLEPLEGTQASA